MMNEEELCLKVQKNWIRIKHESQSIRDRLMDKLLAEGAISVDQIKDIKCRPREEQFDFCLYYVIESRQCKILLRVLETYGRRPLCVAIRKTELNRDDYNTSAQSKLREVIQGNFNPRQYKIPQVNNLQKESIVEQIPEVDIGFEEFTGSIGVKPDISVVKKKVTKTKGKSQAYKEDMKKVKEENDRLKTITRVKSDENSKLRAQLDAKTEEIKWLKAQVGDKDSRRRNQEHLLRKSLDEKLNLQKRLRDSKMEQLELTNKLMDRDSKSKNSKGTYSDDKGVKQLDREKMLEENDIRNKNEENVCIGPRDRKEKHVRVEYADGSLEVDKESDKTIHNVQYALKNAIEERECVNRLLKLENAEVLKLTVAIRTKSEENENLMRQMDNLESPVTKITNKIRINDFDIRDAKDNLESHMKEIEELTERLKPISLKVNEIKERLRILEGN